MMRIFHLAVVAAAGLVIAGNTAAIAQTSNLIEKQDRVSGYVDLRTGLFHAGGQSAPSPETAVTFKTNAGIISVTITTTISADTAKILPKGYTILCDLNVGTVSDGYTYSEVASAPATVSGDTATCTVNLPYSWTTAVTTGTTYAYGGTYKVTASYAPGGDTQALTDFNVIRQTTGVLYNTTGNVFVFPTTGTTTTFKFDATI
jgi:hypothetical protein